MISALKLSWLLCVCCTFNVKVISALSAVVLLLVIIVEVMRVSVGIGKVNCAYSVDIMNVTSRNSVHQL